MTACGLQQRKNTTVFYLIFRQNCGVCKQKSANRKTSHGFGFNMSVHAKYVLIFYCLAVLWETGAPLKWELMLFLRCKPQLKTNGTCQKRNMKFNVSKLTVVRLFGEASLMHNFLCLVIHLSVNIIQSLHDDFLYNRMIIISFFIASSFQCFWLSHSHCGHVQKKKQTN